MTFDKDWLSEQIRNANETIDSWSQTKRDTMVREDLCPPSATPIDVAFSEESGRDKSIDRHE